MNSNSSTSDAGARLSAMMIILATRRVRDVIKSETASLALRNGVELLGAIKNWFLAHNDPCFFANHEHSAKFNKCRDLAQRLTTKVIVSLRRVHNRPPKYSRNSHDEVWRFWIAVCELKYCPLNCRRLRSRKG